MSSRTLGCLLAAGLAISIAGCTCGPLFEDCIDWSTGKTVPCPNYPPLANYTLTVAKPGSGWGTVTGGGIDCGRTCSVGFYSETSVTLAATASSGSSFAGWSGCDSSSGSSCTVGVTGNNQNRTVTANFVTLTPAAVVSTLAGTAGSFGSADGMGAAARFSNPFGVAVDGSGNVYVADTNNNTIRKVTPAGVVSTLAGTAGSSGSADGTGAEARFNFPTGVAVDGSGNVYVADHDNNTIRKVTPAGVVSTLAGTAGSSGSADGTGAEARFDGPLGVAVDGSGNVYVADTPNNTIRKVTPAGVVSTLAGAAGGSGSADGTVAEARFSAPRGVAVDGSGNVYVADLGNSTLRKVTPAGMVSTLAGTAGFTGSADGEGAAARFNWPNSVAVDGSGNVYVADLNNNTIRKVTPPGP